MSFIHSLEELSVLSVTVQRFIDEITRGLTFVYAYIEDILVASAHKQHLEKLFEKFGEYGKVVNPNKCVFRQKQLEFLGYSIDPSGITSPKSKVEAIRNFQLPETAEQLRRFIAMTSIEDAYQTHH